MAYKIIIADDEVYIRLLLEQTLEELIDSHNIEIFSASDGDKALTLILQEKPDLVFLDIMMPKKDGFSVCQTVRKDPHCKNTKILLLTAKGEETDRDLGKTAGATDYLTKPFDPDHILRITKELLDLNR
jgi:DNA-binding response OmpR family regulator